MNRNTFSAQSPIVITIWEFANATGRNVSNAFTINVAEPPAPVITVQPQGGNFYASADRRP